MMKRNKNLKGPKIRYLGCDRLICKICNAPEGFCIHTLEDKYKEHASEFNDIWLATRRYAICSTEKSNLAKYSIEKDKEIDRLHREIEELKIELNHFDWLKKKVEGRG